ncbi:hypothetical protein GLOTRDRAFT_125465 [Gloeophyllum trabeum ATCC 11539]|uniref:Uncharacterized protein n=1 Tax=Gloeophyllum trabeum (strain ATCC 11539 / FP-39264 / Madison 617) TaxID=670483 RepID=S7QIM8_GLOTA|nr:uncharacterized protein GLOTRDRAFT_125465 [Gloeophyllum trabeum ATCC 11539]EPQ59157.1 hypothetical protein GLOTRDRAFT_125465 [Gloeophyllum trabeum ATCC 11539]
MDIRVMLNPDSTEEQPHKRRRISPPKSDAPGNARSSARGRRSDRDTHKKRRLQRESPDTGRSHPSKHGANPSTPKRRHKKTPSTSSASSSGMSPARLLLSQARETVQRDPGSRPHGRKPFIMDVILDALPPPTEFREDILMEALERSERSGLLPSPRRTYAFKDRDSLDAYWADQELIWKDAYHGDHLSETSLTRAKVSAERSTAMWTCSSDVSSDNEQNPL